MINGINAANAYSVARNAVAPSGDAIGTKLGNAAQEFADTMAQVDSAAAGAMTGKTETHELVQSLAEAQLALDTVVAIRDKVVEAYQEILRMPV